MIYALGTALEGGCVGSEAVPKSNEGHVSLQQTYLLRCFEPRTAGNAVGRDHVYEKGIVCTPLQLPDAVLVCSMD